MKTFPLLLLAVLPLAAAEPDLGVQLRNALYTEEVIRDPAKAAGQYEKIVSDFDKQRPLAASALFRLAEIRRKSNDKDNAIGLYQRLIRDYPSAEAEAKLSRQHLTELGGEIPGPPDAPAVLAPGRLELARLEALETSAPDMLRDPKTLENAASQGWAEAVTFLLDRGADANQGEALELAVKGGYLEVCRVLIQHAKPTPEIAGIAISAAIDNKRAALLKELLNLGLSANSPVSGPTSSPLHLTVLENAEWAVAPLIASGADPNAFANTAAKGFRGTPLRWAAKANNAIMARLLIKLGAKVDLAEPDSGNTPLVAAAENGATETLQLLLEKGANPKQPRALEALLSSDSGSLPAVRLLLNAGCDPNAPGPSGMPPIARLFGWDLKSITNGNDQLAAHHCQVELIKILLAHGADPNTTYGTYSIPRASANSYNSSILAERSFFLPPVREERRVPKSLLLMVVDLASKQGMQDVSLIGTLLDAGAKPGEGFPVIFDFVARGDDKAGIARKLLPFRPDFLNTEVNGGSFSWTPAVRRLFSDEVLNPALVARGGVSLVSTEGGSFQLVASDDRIPETHQLLLDHLGELSKWTGKGTLPILMLVRRDEAKQWTRSEIDLSAHASLPSLQQGDILEITPVTTKGNSRFSLGDRIESSALWWPLLRRVVVPIILQDDGRERPITLRGDCLQYDPLSAVAPCLSSKQLAPLLWDPGYTAESGPMPSLIVTRDGWGEIPVEWDAANFQFQAGDRVRLKLPENVAEIRA